MVNWSTSRRYPSNFPFIKNSPKCFLGAFSNCVLLTPLHCIWRLTSESTWMCRHDQSRGHYSTSKQLTKVLDLTLIWINLYTFRHACRYEEITLSVWWNLLSVICIFFIIINKKQQRLFSPIISIRCLWKNFIP